MIVILSKSDLDSLKKFTRGVPPYSERVWCSLEDTLRVSVLESYLEDDYLCEAVSHNFSHRRAPQVQRVVTCRLFF